MPIRVARSGRTARSCVGVRQLLAVDPESIDRAMRLLDSGAITQAAF
jgi:hypothetical protein